MEDKYSRGLAHVINPLMNNCFGGGVRVKYSAKLDARINIRSQNSLADIINNVKSSWDTLLGNFVIRVTLGKSHFAKGNAIAVTAN